MDANCLIVLNNFEGADIKPTVDFPLIIKQFEVALARVDYTYPIKQIRDFDAHLVGLPKAKIDTFNGNFSPKTPNRFFLHRIHVYSQNTIRRSHGQQI